MQNEKESLGGRRLHLELHRAGDWIRRPFVHCFYSAATSRRSAFSFPIVDETTYLVSSQTDYSTKDGDAFVIVLKYTSRVGYENGHIDKLLRRLNRIESARDRG